MHLIESLLTQGVDVQITVYSQGLTCWRGVSPNLPNWENRYRLARQTENHQSRVRSSGRSLHSQNTLAIRDCRHQKLRYKSLLCCRSSLCKTNLDALRLKTKRLSYQLSRTARNQSYDATRRSDNCTIAKIKAKTIGGF